MSNNKLNGNNKISIKFVFLIILFLFIAGIPCRSREMGRLSCKKAVVDSVNAIGEMHSFARMFNETYQRAIDKLSQSPGNEEKIEMYKGMLFSYPDTFSVEGWYKIMSNSDIPTKSIDYERDAIGEDCYEFMELVNSFFPLEEEKERFQDRWTAVGKFDGLITERIGIFPVIDNFESYKRNEPIGVFRSQLYYNKILLKSMRETVPPILIPLGFETKGETVFIQTINSFWDGMDRTRDGFSILFYDPVKRKSKKIFYYFDGKEWKIGKPMISEVLTYDESIKRLEEEKSPPKILEAKCVARNSRTTFIASGENTLCFLLLEEGVIGPHRLNRQPMLKYEVLKNGGKVTGNCYLDMPWALDIFVSADYRSSGNDVIVVEYFSELRERKRNIYLPIRDYSLEMDGMEINGGEFDNSIYLKKIAEGTLDYSTKIWNYNDFSK